MSELHDGLKKMRFWNVKVQADNLRQIYKCKDPKKKERDSEKHWATERV